MNLRATTELLLLLFFRGGEGGVPPFIVCVPGRSLIRWSSSDLNRLVLTQVTRKLSKRVCTILLLPPPS